jgi:transcriptional regulator with XRE-family HTH domain
MTQSELGRQLGLSRQSVQKIESCEVRLDLLRYVTLCRILGLNAGQLLARLEEPSDEDDFSFTYQRCVVVATFFRG